MTVRELWNWYIDLPIGWWFLLNAVVLLTIAFLIPRR